MTTIRFWRVPGGWRFKINTGTSGYVAAPYPSLRAALAGAWRANREVRR